MEYRLVPETWGCRKLLTNFVWFVSVLFAVLAGVLSSSQLLDMLQTGGEPMAAEELQQVLAALTGCDNPEEALPEFVDAGTFMTEVLGFA